MSKMLFVQGLIFPKEFAHGTVLGAPSVSKEFLRYAFSGIIGPLEAEPKDPSLTGVMLDQWGESTIFNFVGTPERVLFQKKYDKEDSVISFEFIENTGNFWIGRYLVNEQWSGTARLIITPIDHLFLNHEIVPI